jgi:hypothetical protein
MPPAVSHSAAKQAPLFWVLFALLLLGLFWVATLWITRFQAGNPDPEEAARAELRTKTLAELHADDTKKLDSYAWIDRTKGTVQVPIQEAMILVLPQLNANPPHAAYPVVASPAIPAPAAPVAPAPPEPTPPVPATAPPVVP